MAATTPAATTSTAPPPPQEVQAIVQNALTNWFSPEATYLPRKANEWVDGVADACLRDLAAQGRPYKYAVACTLMQRTGAGLASGSAAFWDPWRDASQVVVWENDHLQVLVAVHALCLDVLAAGGPTGAGGE